MEWFKGDLPSCPINWQNLLPDRLGGTGPMQDSAAQLQKHLPPTVPVAAWEAQYLGISTFKFVHSHIIQHNPALWLLMCFIYIFFFLYFSICSSPLHEQSYFRAQRTSKAHCHETATSFRNLPH